MASNGRAVLNICRSLMSWYATRDDRFNSPIEKGMNRDQRSADARKRSRVLDDVEIRLLWKACEDLGTYGALVQLLLLSGQRLRKVASMQWDDISADGIWTIRTAEREKGTGGKLKLPQLALDILDRLPRIAGNPHAFAASRSAKALNDFSKCKALLDARLPADMPPWVLHDLRRTARSLMPRAKVPNGIAERVPGHAIKGVEGTYHRFDYLDEKADALQRLAALIETILNPSEGTLSAIVLLDKLGAEESTPAR
jgi:integrase